MQQLQLRRIRFSREADSWLKVLKSRTGITPNVLCRLALSLSLAEPGTPSNDKFPEDSEREINRYTLLGEYELAVTALLRQRVVGNDKGASLDDHFRAHMHRGILLLATRLKTLGDLGTLAPPPGSRGHAQPRG